ncbi:MAG: hypothetical protein AAB534_01620 [Patescibacteria group bacterium]
MSHDWREENGVIYFSVTSDGTTGEGWMKWFDENFYPLSDEARTLLRSPFFVATSGVTTEIAVLKVGFIPVVERTTLAIRIRASQRDLRVPNAEVVCLIRRMFTNDQIREMGLYWIVALHNPLHCGNEPFFLVARWHSTQPWLVAYCVKPTDVWDQDGGVAFAVSSTSTPAQVA